ncbi:MAG: hypothetical protein C0609_02415 [Deltaproteobacteria bacterium]|nr:MAG: hypothetical protein C0609_02415 [Deltaproteobacteria bacterium]
MSKLTEGYLRLAPLKKALIWAVVGILIGAIYWGTAFRSSINEINALERKYTQLDASLREKQAIAANLPIVKEAVAKLDYHLEQVKKKLPLSEEIPALLKSVSDNGTESGLEAVLFRPGKLKPVPPKYFYAEVPFTMNYQGHYHDLGTFLERISRLPRIVSIDKIDATTETYMGSDEPLLKLNIEARTFRFLPPEERPVEEKKGANRRNR